MPLTDICTGTENNSTHLIIVLLSLSALKTKFKMVFTEPFPRHELRSQWHWLALCGFAQHPFWTTEARLYVVVEKVSPTQMDSFYQCNILTE